MVQRKLAKPTMVWICWSSWYSIMMLCISIQYTYLPGLHIMLDYALVLYAWALGLVLPPPPHAHPHSSPHPHQGWGTDWKLLVSLCSDSVITCLHVTLSNLSLGTHTTLQAWQQTQSSKVTIQAFRNQAGCSELHGSNILTARGCKHMLFQNGWICFHLQSVRF